MFEFSNLTIGLLIGAAMLGLAAVYVSVLSGIDDRTNNQG